MSDKTYTLYSSTTCTRCPLARRSMERAGVKYNEVVLDKPGNKEVLADFREEMAGRNVRMEMPIVRTPDDRILSNLAHISEEFRASA